MAEILSAGVYIEEVASSQNVIPGVSTSNLGVIGFTPKGPTDVATLVTSFTQFTRIFGADNKHSLAVKSIQAFYANGGRRAFFVRVVPSDSVKADGRIQSTTYNTVLETGDGVATVYSKTASNSVLKDNGGATPIVPGSFTAKFRGVGAALSDDPARARDGTTALVGDGVVTEFEGRIDPYKHQVVGTGASGVYFRALLPGASSVRIAYVSGGSLGIVVSGNDITITYEAGVTTATALAAAVNVHAQASLLVNATALAGGAGVVVAVQALTLLAGIPAIDTELDVVTSGTGGVDVVITWGSAGGKSLTFPAASAGPVVTGTSADGTGSFDRRTGIFSVTSTVAVSADPVMVTGTAASDTYTIASGTTVDTQGRMLLTGAALSGTGITTNHVNVADGSYSVELSGGTLFHRNGKMVASYKINAWNILPISNGVWGNDLRVDISGNQNYFTASTGQYSKFNVNVLTRDNTTQLYSVAETYEELVFDDPTSAVYFPDVLNELSDLIAVVEPGADEAPGELGAVSHSYVIGGGDGSTAGKAFSLVLPNTTVARRSVVITYTSDTDDLVKTITDDGSGSMVGDVDGAGTNTISYTSGAVSFSTVHPVKAGTLVAATYATAAAETTHTEKLGDDAKDYSYTLTVGGLQSFYTAGSDGTFTGSTYTRSQFTDPALIPDNKGLYALNRVDELMQVIVPDFTSAGDIAVIGDLLDYAADRASSPSGGDRFIILTTPKGSSPQEAVDWFRYTLGRYSKYAALYWPWVTVADSLSNGRNLTIPPLGHVAGVYARTDATKNVGKSPGGTVDGALRGLTGLEYVSTLGERDFVYPHKINPLIDSAQTGLAIWGVRTIAIESEWRYINARRLFMFVEKSVFNATHWIVFENNGPMLWAKVKAQLTGFLTNLFNEGYFAGNSPSQAFFVICDETNNPQSSIDAGQVIIDVGLAPNKPAEFVRFRFSQVSL
jgi:phage tail sheath protein FI